MRSVSPRAKTSFVGREGAGRHPHRRVPGCPRDFGARLVGEHGAHHEGAGSSRQLDELVHGVEEDHGGEPEPFHHDGAQEESLGRQVGQDREGSHLASVPEFANFSRLKHYYHE